MLECRVCERIKLPAGNCLHQLCKSAYFDCDLSLVRVIVRFVQQGYGVSFDNVVRKSAVYFMINVFHYPMMADRRQLDYATASSPHRLSLGLPLGKNVEGMAPFEDQSKRI